MILSIDEKIGQRFIFGVNNDNIDDIIQLIKKRYIGGVVLYKKNYDSYDNMLEVIKRLKDANKNNKIPLFITTDQEGGRVNRMPQQIHVLKNIYDISKYSGELVKDNARITGKMLYNAGINMNLAPVMDIYDNSKSKVLYKRCFYGDSLNVSRLGKNYMDELIKSKVIPVVKHFPGHGISKYDSHFMIPYVFNYHEVLNRHIKPFEGAIDSGCDVIMLGHLVIRKLTNGLPASISSSFITKYLRNNYDGIIMSDELNMLRRNIFYKFIYVNKALVSDNDILLIKIKDYNEGYKIINKYKRLLLKKQEYINKLDYSIKRIVTVKNKYKINDSLEIGKIKISDINREIDMLNNLVNFTKD